MEESFHSYIFGFWWFPQFNDAALTLTTKRPPSEDFPYHSGRALSSAWERERDGAARLFATCSSAFEQLQPAAGEGRTQVRAWLTAGKRGVPTRPFVPTSSILCRVFVIIIQAHAQGGIHHVFHSVEINERHFSLSAGECLLMETPGAPTWNVQFILK